MPSKLEFNASSPIYSVHSVFFDPHNRLSGYTTSSITSLTHIAQCPLITVKRIWSCWCAFCSKVAQCFKPRTFPKVNRDLSPEGLKKMYWGLGKENKWREFIDGKYHHLNDKFCFDKGVPGSHVEPGFIASMESAAIFVESSLGKRIDADWYLQLHRHVAAHFNGAATTTIVGQEKIGMFRNSDDHTAWKDLSGEYAMTTAAQAEFERLNEELKREFGPTYGVGTLTYNNPEKTSTYLRYQSMSREQFRQVFDKFLNECYQELGKATTPDQKLMAIAKLQQRLEWLHPPCDGSSRTNTLLMNKLLTEHGFHPALLKFPHVSSTYGLNKWKLYLQQGLIHWENECARLKKHH